jgi:hypothetical protein
LLTIFLTFSFCVYVTAHSDRVIELKDGKLIGFPEKYQPAYLDLNAKSLQIGTIRFDFPACVSKYFSDDEQFEIEIISSWYHSMSRLPPYISIKISPKGKMHSYNLLLNMDTLRPIEFEIAIIESETTISYHELKINKRCKELIETSYSVTK